jgi:hypothetical protein
LPLPKKYTYFRRPPAAFVTRAVFFAEATVRFGAAFDPAFRAAFFAISSAYSV